MKKRTFGLSAIILVSILCGIAYPEGSGTFITATGTGYPPRGISDKGQAHLLAKRAAMVDGYRNVLNAYKKVSPYIVNGTGTGRTSGFIRGTREIDTRYYNNGKVEVILGIEVILNKDDAERINASGCNIVSGNELKGLPGNEITRTEWMELMKKGRKK